MTAHQTPFQGVGYLSRNAQSSLLHTPLSHDPITTNQEVYDKFIRDQATWIVKPKWGNSRLHCGFETTTKGDSRSKVELSHLDKNHLHFGGGELSYTRTFPLEGQYDVTKLKKSNVRPADELIPNNNKFDVRVARINLPFHVEHPCSSHIPKKALFPAFDSPDDTKLGRVACANDPTLPCTAASMSDNVIIADKTKGSPYRREILRPVRDSERRRLQSHDHSFNQLIKGTEMKRQQFYPTPPSSISPNYWNRPGSLTVSESTANVLRNLQALYTGKSEYSRQYTGNGPSGQLRFNDCGEVMQAPDEHELPPGKGFSSDRMLDDPNRFKENGKDMQQIIRDQEQDKPYATTYNTDYSPLLYIKRINTPSAPILRNSKSKSARLTQKGLAINKSVKFNQKVIFSNGYETSSCFVKDDKENDKPRRSSHRPQTPCRPAETKFSNEKKRPATAFTRVSQSFTQADNQVPQSDLIMQRPFTTERGRKLRDELLQLQDNYSLTAAHRKFHDEFPEDAPDIRRKPDTRITTNERRHVIPEVGCHSYYFHG